MHTSAGIMFLDFKGYGLLNHQQLRDFHSNIYRTLSEIINKGESGEPYVYKKTWCDGIVLAHHDVYKLATVALEIRDYFNNRIYERDSNGALIGKELQCRIAIHFGEFDTIDNPIDGTKICFGDAIPARIEPTTEPGHVWATILATQYLYNKQKDYGHSQLSWAYKGKVLLAKSFGEHHIWVILWVNEQDADGKGGSEDEPCVPQDPQVDLAEGDGKRNGVFISYSRADQGWLDRVRVHLKPLEREHSIDVWSDTMIESGQKWRDQIEAAIERSKVALLLISADFLASDFIVNNELPPLLQKAASDDAIILPLIIKPSRYLREPSLCCYQAVNDPQRPLIAVSEAGREEILVKLSEDIECLVSK